MVGERVVNVFGITLKGQNLGVGCLVVLFIIGYILFCKADRINKVHSTEK